MDALASEYGSEIDPLMLRELAGLRLSQEVTATARALSSIAPSFCSSPRGLGDAISSVPPNTNGRPTDVPKRKARRDGDQPAERRQGIARR